MGCGLRRLVRRRSNMTDAARIERFWNLVDRSAGRPSSCWIWLGVISDRGWGRLTWNRLETRAHRKAYELMVGAIPVGLTLDHLCRTRSCVNPSHLEAVSIGENALRGNGPAAVNKRKTHCVNKHEFTANNTHYYNGKRSCRRCAAIRQRGYVASRKKAEASRLSGAHKRPSAESNQVGKVPSNGDGDRHGKDGCCC